MSLRNRRQFYFHYSNNGPIGEQVKTITDIGMCRVEVEKKPKDDTDSIPVIWSPYPPGGGNCSCNCRAGGVDDVSRFRFARATARSCPMAGRTVCGIAVNRLSIGVANIHHVQASCSDGRRYSGKGTPL